MKTTSDAGHGRRRNAEATRGAILASARRLFAQAGYDGVGVREIARGAGVTAMLVNRYFGSKERLFAEVVADTMTNPVILTGTFLSDVNAEGMAQALVELTTPGSTALDGFLVLIHSASNPQAAKLAGREVGLGHLQNLRDALNGPLRPERAALALSVVAGVQVMRQMMRLAPLVEAKPEVLRSLLAGVFEVLLRPPAE